MIIDKPGKYRLTKDWSSRGSISITQIPAGTVLTITKVDQTYRKVIGPKLLDWTSWDLPVEEEEVMPEKPYQPSNGSEGDFFMAEWCNRCAHEGDEEGFDYCPIIDLSMTYDVMDPEYPKEWIYRDGKPTCTKFEERKP